MKKFFSILIAHIVLLSGMHLSMATHICGGEIAEVKWSFTGENASCGMESTTSEERTSQATLQSNCCQNQIATYTVDNNYCPSIFQYQVLHTDFLQTFTLPVSYNTIDLSTTTNTTTNVVPPNYLQANAVRLIDICTYLI